MSTAPAEAVHLLETALVSELTVIDAHGRPVTYPLIPLFDGAKIWMTSSVLFSRKLEHIKANPKVAVSITDSSALADAPISCLTIQGDAQVVEDDVHDGWQRVMPLWEAKEPVVRKFLKQRFALPLFWERSMIEITPRRYMIWEGSDPTPVIVDVVGAGGGQ